MDDWEEVLRLLYYEDVNVHQLDEQGVLPLHIAIPVANPDILRLLLKHGAELNARDKRRGKTALQMAWEQDWFEAVMILQEHATAIGQRLDVDALSCQTVLLCAIATDDAPAVRSLLDAGANPNAPSPKSGTVLHWAAKHGRDAILRILLEYGAAIDARDANSNTALHSVGAFLPSSPEQHAECVRVLLEHGAEVDARNAWQSTPLIISAAWAGSPAAVRLLLEHGADIHAEDINGASALAQAGWLGDEETIRLLLAWGAASHPKHLQHAFRSSFLDNNNDKARLFVEAGLPIELADAVLLGDMTLVEEFLRRGADVSALEMALVAARLICDMDAWSLLLKEIRQRNNAAQTTNEEKLHHRSDLWYLRSIRSFGGIDIKTAYDDEE